MASAETTDSEQTTAQRTVLLERLDGVGRARRVEAAR